MADSDSHLVRDTGDAAVSKKTGITEPGGTREEQEQEEQDNPTELEGTASVLEATEMAVEQADKAMALKEVKSNAVLSR